jgi:hypothetical protein
MEALPGSLDDFLEKRVSQILMTNDEIRQHSLLMIVWVLCAQAPVSLTALLPILYPDLKATDSIGPVDYFQRITGNLITFVGNLRVPGFTHSSIKEYLEASRSGRYWSYYRGQMGGRWESTPQFVSLPAPSTGLRNLPYDHATFALECIKLLSREDLDFGSNGPSLQQAQNLAFRCEFLKYAAVYWGVHVTLHHKDLETANTDTDDKFKELATRSVNFLTDQAKLKTSLVIAQYLKESGENTGNPLAMLTPSSVALDVVGAFGLPETIEEEIRKRISNQEDTAPKMEQVEDR